MLPYVCQVNGHKNIWNFVLDGNIMIFSVHSNKLSTSTMRYINFIVQRIDSMIILIVNHFSSPHSESKSKYHKYHTVLHPLQP